MRGLPSRKDADSKGIIMTVFNYAGKIILSDSTFEKNMILAPEAILANTPRYQG